MKKQYYFFLMLFISFFSYSQTTAIPDANFEQTLIDLGADDLLDGFILNSSAELYEDLIFGDRNITDMTGIEAFKNLKSLKFFYNNIPNLDLSKNTKLTNIFCESNNITSINVSGITDLKEFNAGDNIIKMINLSDNINLEILDLNNNQLTVLDVSRNIALNYLYCYNNQLSSLDVSQNKALTQFICFNNQLSSLDVSQNIALTDFSCFNNQLSSLDVQHNSALNYLYCGNNQISSLDVSQNKALTLLYCGNNQITTLDITQNLDLNEIEINNNQITSLDLSKHSSLRYLMCQNNNLTSLNVKNGNNLNMPITHGYGSSFNSSNNPSLKCIDVDDEVAANKDRGAMGTAYFFWKKDSITNLVEDCSTFKLNTYVPDDNFEQAIDRDSVLNDSVPTIKILNMTVLNIPNYGISDLTGIEQFKKLTELYCQGNNLTTLNLSNNTKLSRLQCHYNNLTNLDLSKNVNLTWLLCFKNNLTRLNLKNGNTVNNLMLVNLKDNPDLYCAQVDDPDWSSSNWYLRDTQTSFSGNCRYEEPPEIVSTLPTNNAFNVSSNELEITFNKAVKKGSGNILIKNASDDNIIQTIDIASTYVTINDTIVTINLPADLKRGTTYYIQIPNTAFTNLSSTFFLGVLDKATWTFTTVVNKLPTFTSTPVTSIDVNQPYNYIVTTNDEDNDIVKVTTPTLPTWLSLLVQPSDEVTTIAGTGEAGFADGPGATAQFHWPKGLTVDVNGNIYVADYANHRIRKITSTGMVTTLAGSGMLGFADGIGTAAMFYFPTDVAVDSIGNVYVVDKYNHRIRKITPTGVVSTFAGSGEAGSADGMGTAAQFKKPIGIAIDISGNFYITDSENQLIRKITSTGLVTTLAGSGIAGFADGTGTGAAFNNPNGLTVDVNGNIYVADYANHRIRKITSTGAVTTLAGSGIAGFADGTGTVAQFYYPIDVAVDRSGNVYVTDLNNRRIRKITPTGEVTTFAGSGVAGYADGTGTQAQFFTLFGIAINTLSGNAYVADKNINRIRKIKGISILSGDTSGQAGTYSVVLNANDEHGGSTDQSFIITVNADTTPPEIVGTIPADDATGITSSNLQIIFNEDVQKGTGDILIRRLSDDEVVGTIPISGSGVTIDNTANKGTALEGTVTINISSNLTLPSNTDLYIEIPDTAFKDLSSNPFPGFTANSSWNFSTDVVLGIGINAFKGLSLYPNPVRNVLTISATATVIKQVEIYSLLGKKLKTIKSDFKNIDTKELAVGMYLVKIVSEKGIVIKKLIKE